MNQQLHTIFQTSSQKGAPEFIVYTSKLSERLTYSCKFIFEHVLNCTVSTTDNKQKFKNSSAYKISYSTHSEKSIINISPYDLLYKTGIDENYRPKGTLRNGAAYFHLSDSSCDLGYDIFSSVFYFISRYEEYQRFDKDEHGRFELDQSILTKNRSQLRPVVNIWIEELKQALLKFYPDVKFPVKKFQYISTIDVDNLYAYKHKGFIRTMGACAKDLITLRWANLFRRTRVVLGGKADPFDVYSELNSLSRSKNIPLFYFFLQRTGTKYDRTIDPTSRAFKNVFQQLNEAGMLYGLHPSYNAINDDLLLKEELKQINENSGRTINISRQHYLRFDIRSTPMQLIAEGITTDFSMGFAAAAGYRAGTFTPFYFYDLKSEKQTELLMVPFAVMDGAYFVYSNSRAEDAEGQILELAQEVKRLNGLFITVFHERTFDKHLYPGFGELYRKLLDKLA